MEIIHECPLGHRLKTTPWVDANGNFRVIVTPCGECSEPKNIDKVPVGDGITDDTEAVQIIYNKTFNDRAEGGRV